MNYLDFNNLQIHPSVKGSASFQTSFGGLTILVSGLLTFLCSYAFGRELWEKTNPSVNTSDQFLTSPPIIPKNSFNVAFSAQLIGGYIIPDVDKYIKLSLLFTDTDSTRPMNNVTIFTPINYAYCNETVFFKQNKEDVSNFLIGDKAYYYCIDYKDPSVSDITGVFGNSTFKTWSILINYCQNSTENFNSCKSREEIQQFLDNFFFHLIFSDYYVDSNDFHNPIKKTYSPKISKVSAKTSRRDIYTLKHIEYFTDVGLMLGDTISTQGFILSDSQSEFFYNPNTNEILKVIITNSNLKTIINRSYTKIQKVTADIGGFIKFCSLILSFLNSKYSMVKFYNYLDTSMRDTKENSSKLPLEEYFPNKSLNVKEMLSNDPKSINLSHSLSNFVNLSCKSANTKPNSKNSQSSKKEISFYNSWRFYIYCKMASNEEIKRIQVISQYFKSHYSFENLFQMVDYFQTLQAKDSKIK